MQDGAASWKTDAAKAQDKDGHVLVRAGNSVVCKEEVSVHTENSTNFTHWRAAKQTDWICVYFVYCTERNVPYV